MSSCYNISNSGLSKTYITEIFVKYKKLHFNMTSYIKN